MAMNHKRNSIPSIALWLLVYLLIPTITSGQYASGAYEVEFGPEFQFKKTRYIHQIIAEDSLRTYVTFTDRNANQQILREFDANLKPTGRELQLDSKDVRFDRSLGLIKFGQGYLNLVEHQEKWDLNYYYQPIDVNTMSVEPKKLLCRIKGDVRSALATDRNLSISPNDSLLVFAHSKASRRKDQYEINVHVLDYGLNLIENITYTLPHTIKRMDLYGLVITNDGTVYARARNHGNKLYDYDFRLYELRNGVVKECHRTFTNKYHIGLSTMALNEEQVVISGYYGLNAFGNIRGYQYQVYNISTGEMVVDSLVPFPDDYFCYGLSDKQKKRRKEKINNSRYEDHSYSILRTAFIKDENVLLAAEEAVRKNNNGPLAYAYLTETMALVAINKKGQLLWHQKINKNNAMLWQRLPHASYLANLTDNNLYCYFNTNKYFLRTGYNNPETLSEPSAAIIAISKINLEDGTPSHDILIGQPHLGSRRLVTKTIGRFGTMQVLGLQGYTSEHKSQLVRIRDRASKQHSK